MAGLSASQIAIAGSLILLTSSFLRLLYILPSTSRRRRHVRATKPKTSSSYMMIVLGSGGHTAEMMSLISDVDPRKYAYRTYVVSSGDSFSSGKAHEIEKSIQSKSNAKATEPTDAGVMDQETGTWDIVTVPRARKIHQPLYTAPFSSFWCLMSCLYMLHQTATTSNKSLLGYPDVIITNGPATAVIVILAASILKFLGLAPVEKMRIIYVESWARVKTLSLSGKILLHLGICDKFLVQWESLAASVNGTGGVQKVEFAGFLVD